MRALKVAVAVMSVLIVVGMATLAAVIVRRLGSVVAPTLASSVVLDEPAGTRMVGSSAAGDRVVLRLEGGGPDRVAVVDLRSGRVVGRVGLAR